MTRYLLDTNIISNVTKPTIHPRRFCVDGGTADDDLFISALTVAEIRRGCWRSQPEKTRTVGSLVQLVRKDRRHCSRAACCFDEKAALIWARLMADGTARERPRSALDMIIAAVAEANGCVVVRNEKDFAGLIPKRILDQPCAYSKAPPPVDRCFRFARREKLCLCKNIRFSKTKSLISAAVLSQQRGGSRSSRTRGRMRWTRAALRRER